MFGGLGRPTTIHELSHSHALLGGLGKVNPFRCTACKVREVYAQARAGQSPKPYMCVGSDPLHAALRRVQAPAHSYKLGPSPSTRLES